MAQGQVHEPTVVGCGCAVAGEGDGTRRAVGVDPEIKARNIRRLRCVEGQIRGLQ